MEGRDEIVLNLYTGLQSGSILKIGKRITPYRFSLMSVTEKEDYIIGIHGETLLM